ncbi:MAG TPA: sialidase family protein [Woeseiaceae bacterium]|nr:sialidase family protein [Woeseiaceae bacterium]
MNRITTVRLMLLAIPSTLVAACDPAPATATSTAVEQLAVPAAPGSQSPNLAVGQGGVVALSWVTADETGHRLQYSVLAGNAWSEPRNVARGDDWFVNWADFPSVVPVSGEMWAAHWLVRQPAGGYAYDVHLSASSDGGATWSESVMPHDDNTPTEHGFVTIFPDATGMGLIWLDGRNMAHAASHGPSHHSPTVGMTLRAATYSSSLEAAKETLVDELICDCCQTDVAITAQGAIAVYRNRTKDETRDIYAARYVDGEWLPGRAVADDGWTIDGCPVNGPAIAADGDHVAVAWFTAAGDLPKVRMARSNDSGETWSAAVDVTEGGISGRAGVALLDQGRVAVSWLCGESETHARLCLRRIGEDNTLGRVHIVSGEDQVPSLSVPQLARSGDAIIASWTARDGNVTGIRSSRITVASLR